MGGHMPRGEGRHHKYIDKIQLENGKVRYIYKGGVSVSPHRNVKVLPEDRTLHGGGTLRPGENPNANKNRQNYQAIFNRTQAQSARRNTGNPNAGKLSYKITNTVSSIVSNASKTINDGFNFIKNFLHV